MKSYMYGVQGAFLAVSLCTVCAANTCTDLGNLPFLKNGYTWAGSPFMNLTTGGLMLCAVECIKRSRCMSFNFYLQDGSCEMRDVETSDPFYLPVSTVVHSNINQFQELLARTCEFHDCDVHEACIPEDGDYSCAVEFPSSCADVKQCAPKSDDGEYWIYLRDFNMVKARIYCHNMASTEPSDYLTLPVTNYGYYPILRNPICAGEVEGLAGSCDGNGGEVWFNKIKIDTRSLRVTTNDHTFANYTNSKLLYGVASDCYAKHNDGVKASCGPRGMFTIDLSGTGMAVTPETTWLDTGYKYWMNVTRADDNTRVYMNCGGYPGYCEAEDGLFLQPYDMEVLEESSATEVQCTNP
ncbi:A disintegrin and metalloproteinase with thrombospondin motifs 9-like [Haliotis rufescens]|uniref:A disintegrin and metalloproteinase with thrombospondin motifs 9-like n=1 Tax=Haliotis rufescens TaxID=6454 RepID=UPI00201EEECF|nr:A disintegrin and metalloproteinase with thrombospondin motifs 9-like [Haliotis rufescens]